MQRNIRIILVETSLSANIGAAARAMKTMGLSTLYLVNPACCVHSFDAMAMSAGGLDILQNAQIVSTLDEALAPCQLVAGTSARTRHLSATLKTPRVWVETLSALPIETPIGIVFGRESHGLTNDELAKCHVHLQIPTDSTYGVLNLAQAVQIIAYELQQVQMSSIFERDNITSQYATQGALEHCITRFEQLFYQIQLLNPSNQDSLLMPRLRQFFYRAHPFVEEVNIFEGLLKAVEKNLAT